MLRHVIVAIAGIVSVLAVSFLATRAPDSEPTDAAATAEHAAPETRKLKQADLIVPVFTGGSVSGYIVASVTGDLAPDISDDVATWYLSDALLQLLHDVKDVPTDEEQVPESEWLRDHLETAANDRYAAPLISKLEVARIKYLKRI